MHSVDLFKSDSTHIYNITKDFKFKNLKKKKTYHGFHKKIGQHNSF